MTLTTTGHAASGSVFHAFLHRICAYATLATQHLFRREGGWHTAHCSSGHALGTGSAGWPLAQCFDVWCHADVCLQIGHLMEQLKQRHLLDNTIVVFMSDNGMHRCRGVLEIGVTHSQFACSPPIRTSSNVWLSGGLGKEAGVSWDTGHRPSPTLRGEKGQIYEG